MAAKVQVQANALRLLAVIIFAVLCQSPSSAESNTHYSVEKVLRYQFEISNNSSDVIERALLTTIAPFQQTSTQKVNNIQVDGLSYVVRNDKTNSQFLEIQLPSLLPRSKYVVSITANMLMAKKPSAEAVKKNKVGFLQEEPYIEFTKSPVKEIAEQFTQNKDKPRAIHDWLVSNIEYIGYTAKPMGSRYALMQKQGDCTEFSYAAAALLRANKIPARVLSGFVAKNPRTLLITSDYHNWVEFYQNKTWQLDDAQIGVFADDYEDYIVFRILSDAGSSVIPLHERFLVQDNRLSVRMI